MARRLTLEFRPRMIVAGSSSYPLAIDFRRLAEIAAEVDALLFCDIAHVSGLVIAGLHDNPTPYSAVVTTSTHKTSAGRAPADSCCVRRHAAAIDAAIAPGLQAAPGGHIIAARAVLFQMVPKPAFAILMRHVVANAQALAEGLQEAGATLYAGGTNTHMVVVDLRGSAWTEMELNSVLLDHGVTANTTDLPTRRGGRLGLRLGSTAMTIRGMDGSSFRQLGYELGKLLSGDKDPHSARRIGEWARKFVLPAP
jgi:glycine hydroxymethyltransferase